MNRIQHLMIGFLLIASGSIYAQISKAAVGGYAAFTHAGLNVGADWRYAFTKQVDGYAGIKYLGNRIITDNIGYVYKNRFYATNALEHLGLRAGLQRNFSIPNSSFRPFAFAQLQYTGSRIRNSYTRVNTWITNNPNQPIAYEFAEVYSITSHVVYALEATLGAGFQTQVFGPVDLRLAGGASVIGLSDYINGLHTYTLDYIGLLGEAGLVWHLTVKKPN